VFAGCVEVNNNVAVGVSVGTSVGVAVGVDVVVAVGGTMGTVWKFCPPQTTSVGIRTMITTEIISTRNLYTIFLFIL
jgi:hypothetical protein